jgi:hypothetical protein
MADLYAITWEDVLNTAINHADEMGAFTPAQQNLILNQVTRQVTEAKFYDDTFDARRYLAAHFAAVALQDSAGAGTLSSETIGSVSQGVTLAVNNPKPTQNILATVYGREFWEFVQSNLVVAFSD